MAHQRLMLFFIMASVAPQIGLPTPNAAIQVPVKKNIISPPSALFLKSKIPSWYLTAVQQRLYPTPLRKAEQVVFHHEEEALNASWVVRDRVVFIPQVIRSTDDR